MANEIASEEVGIKYYLLHFKATRRQASLFENQTFNFTEIEDQLKFQYLLNVIVYTTTQ